jgi:hypothetical protein
VILEIKQEGKTKRRLRLGMVGGGPGGFIGAVHRIAARLDDRFELVAAALSSDPERARAAALDLHITPDRAYRSFAEMASSEAARKDRIDAVSIVTPRHFSKLAFMSSATSRSPLRSKTPSTSPGSFAVPGFSSPSPTTTPAIPWCGRPGK